MAMNIKDPDAERLAAEVAELTGESKTAVVRAALRSCRDRLIADRSDTEQRFERFHRFLEDEVWSQLPRDRLGEPISKEEREEILGFGPAGA